MVTTDRRARALALLATESALLTAHQVFQADAIATASGPVRPAISV
jgi:hypothetical protein